MKIARNFTSRSDSNPDWTRLGVRHCLMEKGQDSRSNIPNQHNPVISGNPAVDISSSRLIAQTSAIKSPASCQTVFFA
jgi:hypothetical protein